MAVLGTASRLEGHVIWMIRDRSVSSTECLVSFNAILMCLQMLSVHSLRVFFQRPRSNRLIDTLSALNLRVPFLLCVFVKVRGTEGELTGTLDS